MARDHLEISGFENRRCTSNLLLQVLADVHIMFSRIIPLQEDPERHPFWRKAVKFGATCTTQPSNDVTHVIAYVSGTEKVRCASASLGCPAVHYLVCQQPCMVKDPVMTCLMNSYSYSDCQSCKHVGARHSHTRILWCNASPSKVCRLFHCIQVLPCAVFVGVVKRACFSKSQHCTTLLNLSTAAYLQLASTSQSNEEHCPMQVYWAQRNQKYIVTPDW